jgi:hypothetical protein
MDYRFNPPPNWPIPPQGWSPPPGWQPDPTWPPPPPGWQLWLPVEHESASAASPSPSTGEPTSEMSNTGRSRWAASGSGSAEPGLSLVHRARGWFGRLPIWAKILIVLVAVGLLPWLLIAAGLLAVGIGTAGLLRGSLPRFGLANRATAAVALLLGLVGILAGSGLAAVALEPASTGSKNSPIAAPTTSSAPPTTPTPTLTAPSTTTSPSPAPRTTTATPRPPTTTRPRATRPPTAKPAPSLTVAIVSLPPTGQGNVATATAHTAPNASCSIEVEYKSGSSTAAGLYPKTASASGAVSWSWLVGPRTTPGDWPVTVTCTRRGEVESDQRLLTVLDTGSPG